MSGAPLLRSPSAVGETLPRFFVELQEELGRSTQIEELRGVLAHHLPLLLPVADRVSVVFREPDGEWLRIYQLLPEGTGPVEPLPRVRIEGTPVGSVVRTGTARVCDAKRDAVVTLGHASGDGIRSTVSVPIRIGGRVVGAFNTGSRQTGACTEEMVSQVEQVASLVGPALFAAERVLCGEGQPAAAQVRPPQGDTGADQPAPASNGPDATHDAEGPLGGLVGRSEAFSRVLAEARRAASSNADVLITGETGGGKTTLARAIHGWSARSRGPFVTLHVPDFSSTLVESELFGHEKGAFTGATSTRAGRFERADGGTIFLDEVAEMSHSMQAKFLRVIQDRCFERVGGNQTLSCDVRIIAATSRNLRELIARGEFREDLFYRLNVVPLRVPSLRDRQEDLEPLVHSILERIGDGRVRSLSEGAWKRLRAHHWPGNIRELECVLKRAAILEGRDVLELDRVHESSEPRAEAETEWPTLEEHQRRYVERVLERCGGVIEGPQGAARALGMRPSTLRSRMGRLGVSAQPMRGRGR